MQIKNFNDIKSVFLDNLSVKQTIFKNTFWLAVERAISKLLRAGLIIYIARILGATEYGEFTFALAFVSLFVVFSDLGLEPIITREFTREKEKEEEFYSLLSLKLLLSLGSLIFISIGSFFITSEPAIQKIILILALFSLISGFSSLIYSFFRGWQRMEYQAWGGIFETLLITGCGLLVIFNFPSIENLSYAYLLASIITLIFVLIFFHFKVFPLKIAWESNIWKKFLAISWPLAFSSLFITLYTYIDSVMLGYLGQIEETGWYNAAQKLVRISFIPMGLITTSFFPVLSKFFKESKAKLQRTWEMQFKIMILYVFPLGVGGIILAPKIIDFIYGPEFISSVLAFQILILMAVIILFYRPLNRVLIVFNQQRKIFWITIFGALANIALNLVLIPKFSLYGAAIATVITNVLIFLLYFVFTIKFTSIHPLNLNLFFVFLAAGFSSLVMYFVISHPTVYDLNVILSILIGGIVYLASLFALKSILHYLKPINV